MAFCRSSSRIVLSLVVLGLVCPARAEEADEVALLKDITVAANADGVTIRIDLSHPREATSHELKSPHRVWFDFPDTQVRSGTISRPVNHKLIKAVRAGQFSAEPPIARVVLDLSGDHSLKLARADEGRVLFIGLGKGGGRPEEKPARRPTVSVAGGEWAEEGDESARFVLRLSDMAPVRAFYLDDPERVVLDIEQACIAGPAADPSLRNGLACDVRMTQFESDVVRLVIELRSPAGFALRKLLNPARLELRLARGETRNRLVVIDPGHGGKDAGAKGYKAGLLEKDVVLDIGRRAAELLRGKGVRVVMTRDDDTFIPLSERPGMANNLGAHLFVSIHCNAMPEGKKGTRSGTEVYYHTPISSSFAEVMLKEFTDCTETTARGTLSRRFVVVREALMPSVLVETGYIDHPDEGAKLADPSFRQRCALGVVHGVMRYLERGDLKSVAALD
ncbi:MAG: N-acetylmuramoyl-L-alanine amidase [Armatimonadetes bacterium]|nr:N-acetylmuramoyl-L-alanine amidase [Armatimonadota bacterium]